jgi:hypothetical protein
VQPQMALHDHVQRRLSTDHHFSMSLRLLRRRSDPRWMRARQRSVVDGQESICVAGQRERSCGTVGTGMSHPYRIAALGGLRWQRGKDASGPITPGVKRLVLINLGGIFLPVEMQFLCPFGTNPAYAVFGHKDRRPYRYANLNEPPCRELLTSFDGETMRGRDTVDADHPLRRRIW